MGRLRDLEGVSCQSNTCSKGHRGRTATALLCAGPLGSLTRGSVRIQPGGATTSLHLQVSSPWGNGRVTFPSCGDCDWREWLSSMDFDYISEKIWGLKVLSPDHRKTAANIRGYINELRAEDAITVAEANELRRALREDYALDPERPMEDQIGALVSFVRFNQHLCSFGNPISFAKSAKMIGLERHAWQPLRDVVLSDLERRPEGLVQEVSQTLSDPDSDGDMEMMP